MHTIKTDQGFSHLTSKQTIVIYSNSGQDFSFCNSRLFRIPRCSIQRLSTIRGLRARCQ